jgi:hypothetical protein
VYCHVVEYDWLLGTDPFETTVNIPDAVVESSFELPSAPETNKDDDDTDQEDD